MTLFWILLALLALFGTLVCYSALVVASRADEWEERRRKMTTPKEFAEKMKSIAETETEYKALDVEVRHVDMDNAMCELLTELGYGEGVKIFKNCYKWYS